MRPLSWHAIGSKRVRRCAAPPPGVTSYQLFHIKQLGYTVTGTGNLCLKIPSGIDWPSTADENKPKVAVILKDNLSHKPTVCPSKDSASMLSYQ
jgi:hypothetical protein